MKRLMKFLLAAGAVLCLLAGCKKEETLEVYTLGEDGETVVALDSILGEGEAMLASIDAPTDEATQAGLALSHTYHYREMEDPSALAARYIGVLRTEQGFEPVDEQNRQLVEEPDLETMIGSMILARKIETGDDSRKLFRVVVGWSEYSVAVQVSEADGRILPPPEPEPDPADEPSAGGAKQPTSMTEQLDYFNELNPEKLGLVGNDMHDYAVYPQQGWVLVDGISCREIVVYSEDASDGTNVYMGTYFLSSDLEYLFKKVSAGNLVAVENFK